MVRWEPGARQRLQAAALELFVSRGFEQTTAAEIAQAAGLTERTFFRHFADKREVLFDGQDELQQEFLDGLAGVPADAPLLVRIESALETSAGFFPDERRDYARLRQQVIEAHPALQERELLKMASLATTIAAALRDDGGLDPAVTLAAETGVTVFKVAFGQWISDGEKRSLVDIEHQLMREMAALSSSPDRDRARDQARNEAGD
jgi:AcrR family transcriptional regulator